MTPAERSLVVELFDRLAALEDVERDAEAERLIADGLRQAPNAPYALVQTVLVQDETLKRADARIRELESELGVGEPAHEPGFLESMRNTLLGQRSPPRAGSVPAVPPAAAAMGTSAGYRAEPQAPIGAGGSFLGTAAAAAAGVIGGSLLLGSIRSMMGANAAHAAAQPASSPWADSESGGTLAHQAGLDDIGRAPTGHENVGEASPQGFLDDDPANADPNDLSDDDFMDDEPGGFDGGDFGGDN